MISLGPALQTTRAAARLLARGVRVRSVLRGGRLIGPSVPSVALTFDDGPCEPHTHEILDILARHHVRATFFAIGSHVERYPDLARRIATEHELGVHGGAHARDVVGDAARFTADALACCDLFERTTGVRPRLFRFPWGDPGKLSAGRVRGLTGLTCVLWSFSSGDDHLDGPGIVERFRRCAAPGEIALLHDGVAAGSVRPRPRDATVAALPGVLAVLRERGLAAVTVTELLHSG